MNSLETAKLILITGRPGIGKTTLISRLFDKLKHKDGISVCGFKTEEIRDPENPRSGRLGFDVVLLDSDAETEVRSPLARVCGLCNESVRNPRVGQYSVDISSFEQLAVPCLQSILDQQNFNQSNSDPTLQICVVDEIGKMESFSKKFSAQISRLLELVSAPKSNTLLLATVPSPKRPDGSRGINLVDHMCTRSDACLVEVTLSNRDSLVEHIWNAIQNHHISR